MVSASHGKAEDEATEIAGGAKNQAAAQGKN